MAITLKNIESSDTISSMVDKINFNFDQIILNGGGIQGPKGIEGPAGMQGKTGETGEIGEEGPEGTRGSLIRKYIGSNEPHSGVVLDPNYYDNNLIDGDVLMYVDNNMIKSFWLVKLISDSGSGSGSNESYEIGELIGNLFQNELFEEYNNEVSTVASLVHTTSYTSSDSGNGSNTTYKRGLVLNDYEGNLTLSGSIIESITENNVAVVFSHHDTNSSSFNSGIVFIDDNETGSGSGSGDDFLGTVPRINYVYTSDTQSESGMHIVSPSSNMLLLADKDIKIKTNDGKIDIFAKTPSINYSDTDPSANEECLYNLHYNDNNDDISLMKGVVNAKKVGTVTTYDPNIIINSNNITIGKTYDDLIKISYDDTNESAVIAFKYDTSTAGTCLDSRIEYGKNISIVNKFNSLPFPSFKMDRNNIEQRATQIKLTSQAVDSSTDVSRGITIKQNKIESIISDSSYTEGNYNYAILDGTSEHHDNFKVNLKYPGVFKVSNISESFESCLINYIEPNNSDIENSCVRNKDVYTEDASRVLNKTISPKYASCSFYKNTKIKTLPNTGAFHSGTIKFESDASISVGSDTINDKSYIVYNFTRIGNVVNCDFHSIIDPYFMFALKTASTSCTKEVSINNGILTHTLNYGNENYYKRWQSDIFTLTIGTKTTYANAYTYLNIYPPVMQIAERTDSNTTYITTNIKNLTGHITYSYGNATYEKELCYNENGNNECPVIEEGSGSGSCYVIPPLQTRNMLNSSTSLGKSIKSVSSTLGGTLTSSNTTSTTINYNTTFSGVSVYSDPILTSSYAIEASGHFSYMIDTDEFHTAKHTADNTNQSTSTGSNSGTSSGTTPGITS